MYSLEKIKLLRELFHPTPKNSGHLGSEGYATVAPLRIGAARVMGRNRKMWGKRPENPILNELNWETEVSNCY